MFGCCNNRCRYQSSCFPYIYPPCRPIIPPCVQLPCNQVVGPFELGGVVIGTDGNPVSGMNISYTVNGQPGATITNASGAYVISVPANANVTISAIPGIGVTVTPTSYNITGVNGNIYGLDFTLTAI